MRTAVWFSFLSVFILVVVVAGLVLPERLFGQSELGCQFVASIPRNNEAYRYAGPAGGNTFTLQNPHPKHGSTFSVYNRGGTKSCDWTATASAPWITLTPTSGKLHPNVDNEATITINKQASQLPRGQHNAVITVQSRQDPRGNASYQIRVLLRAQEPCNLEMRGETSYLARFRQGEVPSKTSVVRLVNRGDAHCDWEAIAPAWLNVTPLRSRIEGQGTQQMRIEANEGVKELQPRDYRDVVRVEWTAPEYRDAELPITLEVMATPCELFFEEGQTFEASGKAGSTNFNPTGQKYVLENRGGDRCYNWQAYRVVDWLTIGDETPLYGNGVADVAVEIAQDLAANLRPGVHQDSVRFGAGNDQADNSLAVQLTVEPLPCQLEIVEAEIDFNINPHEPIESETEQPITLKNSWTNSECKWTTESRWEWLTTEPSSGVLPGGTQEVITAKILDTSLVEDLNPGEHLEKLGFVVEDGAADEAIDVTVKIDCRTDEPCAYLHTSHTQTQVGRPATISLSIVNNWQDDIVATLVADVPSGWELDGIGFGADRCSGGVCNRVYDIAGGGFEFIEMQTTPNNAGIFEFKARVSWRTKKPERTEVEDANGGGDNVDGDETQDGATDEEDQQEPAVVLRATVEVTNPSGGADSPVGSPTDTPTTAPTLAPTPTTAIQGVTSNLTVNRTGRVLPGDSLLPPETNGGEPGESSGTGDMPWWAWPVIIVVLSLVGIGVIVATMLYGFKMLAKTNGTASAEDGAT